MGISSENGLSLALAMFWNTSTPQWITGTKVNQPPKNRFGNLFLKVDTDEEQQSNGGVFLKPRLNVNDKAEEWDFDINILTPEDSVNSLHWKSPITGNT